MKHQDPMPQLRKLFLGDQVCAQSVVAVKTRGKPRVEISPRAEVTFRLKRIIKGQTFLGIYPSSTTLPDAAGLTRGDYALLQSGEVIQIL